MDGKTGLSPPRDVAAEGVEPMLGRRRHASFAGLGLIATMGAMYIAGPAQASNVKLDCVGQGEAKLQDKSNPSIGMRLVGGVGNFNLTAGLTCVGVIEKGAPTPAFNIDLISSGWYNNTVCGTGVWLSVPGASRMTGFGRLAGDPLAGKDKFAAIVGSWKYAIEFPFFGDGTWYWHQGAGYQSQKPATIPKVLNDPKTNWPASDKNYVAAGPVISSGSWTKPFSVPNVFVGECTKAIHLKIKFLYG